MPVTIRDIAKEVNTSAVTVSLALRKSPRISHATREKVIKTAEKLGYRPNPMARGLVGSKTMTLGFIFNNSSTNMVKQMAYMEIFNAIATEAANKHYKMFFHTSVESRILSEVVSEAMMFGVDGLILVSEKNKDDKILEGLTVPTVIVNREFYGRNVSCVMFDDKNGVKEGVAHLISQGHKRIAFVGKNSKESSSRRFKAFVEVMNQHGLEVDENLVFKCGYVVEDGTWAGKAIAELKQKPSAIFTATDALSYGLIASLKASGIEIPYDISVMGLDNLPYSAICSPLLTTIDLNPSLLGKTVIDSMMKLLAGQTVGKKEVVPVKLLIRESVKPFEEK